MAGNDTLKKLAIFDVDGTLHMTEVMSIAAYGIVAPKLNLQTPPIEQLFASYGCTSEYILNMLGVVGTEEYKSEVLDLIEKEEVRQMREVGRCYDGVLTALNRLRENDIVLALCSMCSPYYLDGFIDCFGLSDIIEYRRDESCGNDKRLLLKSLLAESCPDIAVMVGDRKFDLEAARYNDIPFIGCAYGYAPAEILESDFIVDSGEKIYDAVLSALRK